MASPMYGQNKFDSKLSEQNDNKFKYIFDEVPVAVNGNTVGKLLDGTEDDCYIHTYSNGLKLYGYYIGANTVDSPPAHAEGVEYSFTDTNDIGNQWMMTLPGSIGKEGYSAYTVGKSAFFAKLKLKISDVSGTDDLHFGFKLASDTVETTGVAYTDFISLNVDAGDIKYETNINNGGATSADSASDWIDDQVATLEVRISQAGAATFYWNGVQLTTLAPTVSFDAGDIVTPWFFFRNASDKTDVILKELEFGLL